MVHPTSRLVVEVGALLGVRQWWCRVRYGNDRGVTVADCLDAVSRRWRGAIQVFCLLLSQSLSLVPVPLDPRRRAVSVGLASLCSPFRNSLLAGRSGIRRGHGVLGAFRGRDRVVPEPKARRVFQSQDNQQDINAALHLVSDTLR